MVAEEGIVDSAEAITLFYRYNGEGKYCCYSSSSSSSGRSSSRVSSSSSSSSIGSSQGATTRTVLTALSRDEKENY